MFLAWQKRMRISIQKSPIRSLLKADLRRISCQGRNHSHTCKNLQTIFCRCHQSVSTRCLVQNFQLIFCSQRVNATSQYNDSHAFKLYKMAKPSVGCSGETMVAPCTMKKRPKRKMTKAYYWIDVQQNIVMFSKL